MAKQHETKTPVDLEETAELPMLPGVSTIIGADDPMGATDSWMVSSGAVRGSVQRPGAATARAADPAENDATHELRAVQSLRRAEHGPAK